MEPKTKSIEKKPISPVLREMEVGQTEEWPRQRATSLRNIIGRVQLETDRKFRTYREGNDIVVTRIK